MTTTELITCIIIFLLAFMGIYFVFLAELFDLNLQEDFLYLGICKKGKRYNALKKK
jgi:hypothetical protein